MDKVRILAYTFLFLILLIIFEISQKIPEHSFAMWIAFGCGVFFKYTSDYLRTGKIE